MTDATLSPERVSELFTTKSGAYRFARWGRPIAPVVFGVDDATLGHLKDAMASVALIAGIEFVETDPELGANLMIFFCQTWNELDAIPDLDRLIPDFEALKSKLNDSDANQYRTFTFDDGGAIQLSIILLRLDERLAETSVQTLGVGQMAQSILLWGDTAFADESPIAVIQQNAMCIVKPNYAALIKAAYDATMPLIADDASHAMRLSARAGLLLQDLNHDA